jgi:hypothetical protein
MEFRSPAGDPMGYTKVHENPYNYIIFTYKGLKNAIVENWQLSRKYGKYIMSGKQKAEILDLAGIKYTPRSLETRY